MRDVPAPAPGPALATSGLTRRSITTLRGIRDPARAGCRELACRRMRIGVDGRALVGEGASGLRQPRGVTRYVSSLLAAMIEGRPQDEWRLLLREDAGEIEFLGADVRRRRGSQRGASVAAAVLGRPRLDRVLGMDSACTPRQGGAHRAASRCGPGALRRTFDRARLPGRALRATGRAGARWLARGWVPERSRWTIWRWQSHMSRVQRPVRRWVEIGCASEGSWQRCDVPGARGARSELSPVGACS